MREAALEDKASNHLDAKWCPGASFSSQWGQYQEFQGMEARGRCLEKRKIHTTNWSNRMF